MRNLSFYLIPCLLMLSVFLSCKKEKEEEAVNPYEPMMGSYSGYFKLVDSDGITQVEEEDHAMVIGKLIEYNGSYYTIANIEALTFIVKLDELSAASDGTIVGKVKIYLDLEDVEKPGRHVAGSGSFSYKNEKITLLWTAASINDEWNLTFISN